MLSAVAIALSGAVCGELEAATDCWDSSVSTREATTELSQQSVAASNSPQTAPLNAIATAVTASTTEATTELPKQPEAASNKSQKAVRSPNQRNQGRYDAAAWGRYAHERPSSSW